VYYLLLLSRTSDSLIASQQHIFPPSHLSPTISRLYPYKRDRRHLRSKEGNDVDHFLDSPLSQEYEDDIQPVFSRNEDWLEHATEKILDEQVYPKGKLLEEDVESIAGLMAAWARRKSVHAALMVEKLLKRVIDDLRSGNTDIHVNTRMYTYVSDERVEFKIYERLLVSWLYHFAGHRRLG